jgi:bifunctional non-homologous end joining protein LigD
MGLQNYRRKRNFHKTPEPQGKVTRGGRGLSFVIQKHAARRLHYDFRLEVNGVLASWAIPKGPSLDPKQRRLAVHVEDHPLEYGSFEGTIPQGQYGAGSVLLWDRGTWIPEGDPAEGLRKGKLKFRLAGEKLRGGWTLVRMKGRNSGDKENWLLIKERDEAVTQKNILDERQQSVQSGRKIDEIGLNGRQWQSDRHDPRKRADPALRPATRNKTKKAPSPIFVRPQLATLIDAVPQGDEWLHEIKFDGYRILGQIRNGSVTFLTREGNDWTGRFSAFADAAADLPVNQALLDGEIVALGADGAPDFQLLQNSLKRNVSGHLIYYVFDLLYLDGRDLTPLPLLARKQTLKKILNPSARSRRPGLLRYSEHWIGQGQALFDKACESGLEGIVSKRKDQPYRSGRNQSWLKVKCLKSQEFVIGGFTEPAGSRTGLGALLLGVHDNGALRYSGRVGTGFSSETLSELRSHLDSRIRKSSPFSNPLTGPAARGVHWVKPDLVGEVAFTGWTEDGVLRQPSFKGLREDKPADQIVREKAAPSPASAASASRASAEVAGIKLTHPDRILYPEQGITKRDLALYYEQVVSWILPHLEGRPLTLVRCPEGHGKPCFYQRHSHDALDPAIHAIDIKEGGSKVSYVSVDSVPGLIALVQIGVLEIHTWGSRKEKIEQPDRLIFDLDPDAAVTWERIKEAAQALRLRLSELGLTGFVKTTGGKGLHVVVPIIPKYDWQFIKMFSKSVAESIVHQSPEQYTTNMSKAKRKGKIFIDYLRNARTATAVCAYSSRARPGSPVSVPVRWDELTSDIRGDRFTIKNVPQRLERMRKDPWHDYETSRARISKSMLQQL